MKTLTLAQLHALRTCVLVYDEENNRPEGGFLEMIHGKEESDQVRTIIHDARAALTVLENQGVE